MPIFVLRAFITIVMACIFFRILWLWLWHEHIVDHWHIDNFLDNSRLFSDGRWSIIMAIDKGSSLAPIVYALASALMEASVSKG